jgi:hypothetical protein
VGQGLLIDVYVYLWAEWQITPSRTLLLIYFLLQDKNYGSLQVICRYYQLECPKRGSSLTFQPLEHLHPLSFQRPSEAVLHIAGSAIDVRSLNTSLELAEVCLCMKELDVDFLKCMMMCHALELSLTCCQINSDIVSELLNNYIFLLLFLLYLFSFIYFLKIGLPLTPIYIPFYMPFSGLEPALLRREARAITIYTRFAVLKKNSAPINPGIYSFSYYHPY